MFFFCSHAETHPMTSRCFGTTAERKLSLFASLDYGLGLASGRDLAFGAVPAHFVGANKGDQGSPWACYEGLAACIAFALISIATPAQSQPSAVGSAGLFSPVPMTGSSPEHRFGRVAAPSSTPTSPQEAEQDAAPLSRKETAAPSASTPTPGPLWTRREIAPAATQTTPKQPPRHRRTASAPPPRREAVKEVSIQKGQGTQRSQVRPNRLGTKPTRVRQEAKSRGQASTWAATDRRATREVRRTPPARIELAPRGEPELPLGLMSRHARREQGKRP
jgi:hypothetical protein